MTAHRLLDKYPFSNRFLRLYAVAVAKHLIAKVDNPDPRSLKAIEVAERYANNQATDKELKEAYDDAYSAYSAATYSAYTAYSAAYSATSTAAYAAATAATIAYAYAAAAYVDVKAILVKCINELSDLEKTMLKINPKDLG